MWEQRRWLAEWDVRNGVCQTCGHPVSECMDPQRVWFPQRLIDHAEMERAAADAAYDALHEKEPYHDGSFRNWAADRSPRHPFHFRDGVRVVVTATDVNPDDHFITDPRATPWPKREEG